LAVFARASEDRLQRLARDLEAVIGHDRARQERERQIETLRRQSAADLFAICRRFVARLNGLLTTTAADITPLEFSVKGFDEQPMQLVQINVSGRVIQFTYQATPDLETTEDFRHPYTLEGSVRWFNQLMIERDDVRDHKLFCVINGDVGEWRYMDSNSRKGGPVDEDYLICLLEELIER